MSFLCSEKARWMASFVLLLGFATSTLVAEETSAPSQHPDKKCSTNDDCLPGPELTSCFRYCKANECMDEEVEICPAFSRTFQRFPDCVVSVPCKRPQQIVCIDQQCVAR